MHRLGVGGEDHGDHDDHSDHGDHDDHHGDHSDHGDHSHPDRKASHQDSELHTPHNSSSSVWDTVRHSLTPFWRKKTVFHGSAQTPDSCPVLFASSCA